MKFKVLILVFILSIVALTAGDSYFEYFTAKSSGDTINLEWKSISETGLSKYELERSSDKIAYSKIQTIYLKGSGSVYNYTDEEAFARKTTDPTISAIKEFSYRIKILRADNSISYSNTVNVAHEVSGFQRTWGMIKEMFR